MSQLVWAIASDIEAEFAGPPSVNALESCPFSLERVNLHVCTPFGQDLGFEDRPRIAIDIVLGSKYPSNRRPAQIECETFILTFTGASMVFRTILSIFLESLARRLLGAVFRFGVRLYTYWRSRRG